MRKASAKKCNTVSHLAKLVPDQVRRIRRLHATDSAVYNQPTLAKMFKVSQPTISFILRGIIYKDVA